MRASGTVTLASRAPVLFRKKASLRTASVVVVEASMPASRVCAIGPVRPCHTRLACPVRPLRNVLLL